MITQISTNPTESATAAEMPLIPQYINAAETSHTIRVYVQACNNGLSQFFDVLLDAGSPIKPRLEQLLAGWQIVDWMPDGVF